MIHQSISVPLAESPHLVSDIRNVKIMVQRFIGNVPKSIDNYTETLRLKSLKYLYV